MVLVDTSVWVTHLRKGHPGLVALLDEGTVAIHPFVIGELACGNLKNRGEILSLLRSLPTTLVAENEEVLLFIERNRLMGVGLGYVDAHLLASAALSGVNLWTEDKALAAAARALKLDFNREC